jgi:hypothetical protein
MSAPRIAAACLVVAQLALAAVPAAAAVIVVDAANGPGATTTSLQTGIDLAVDGDTVLVRAGAYSGFTLSDESLVITADTGAMVTVNGRMAITNLFPGKKAVLRGLTSGTVPAGQVGLLVSQCFGPVLVEACKVTGGTAANLPGTRVLDSVAVTLVRVDSTGGPCGNFPQHSGGPGLEVKTSTVVAFGCVFKGSSGAWHDDIGGGAGPGARVSFATLHGSGCEFRGGDSGGADDDFDFFCGCIICGYIPPGGAAVEMPSNTFGAVSLLDCLQVPGAGGFSTSAKSCPSGSPGVPFSGPASALTTYSGTSRSLRVTSPVRENGTGSLKAQGLAGDQLVLFVGLEPVSLLTPQYKGALFTLPAVTIAAGLLPAGGSLEMPFTAPPLPASIPAVQVVVQGIFVDGAGAVTGSGSAVTLLDDAL